MAWISHLPQSLRGTNKEIVKITFQRNITKKKPSFVCFIGVKLASSLGFEADGRVELFFDDKDSRKFLVQNAVEKKAGYKLLPIINKNNQTIFLKFTSSSWLEEKDLIEGDFKMRVVPYEIIEGGIVVDAN